MLCVVFQPQVQNGNYHDWTFWGKGSCQSSLPGPLYTVNTTPIRRKLNDEILPPQSPATRRDKVPKKWGLWASTWEGHYYGWGQILPFEVLGSFALLSRNLFAHPSVQERVLQRQSRVPSIQIRGHVESILSSSFWGLLQIKGYVAWVCANTPHLPFKTSQIPSNRDHEVLDRGTLGGLGGSLLWNQHARPNLRGWQGQSSARGEEGRGGVCVGS